MKRCLERTKSELRDLGTDLVQWSSVIGGEREGSESEEQHVN